MAILVSCVLNVLELLLNELLVQPNSNERATSTKDRRRVNDAGASAYRSLEMNKTAADIHSERNKEAVEFVHNEAVKQVLGCENCMM